MATANEEILNRAIRHAVYLQRLESHEVEKLLSLFNKDILPDLLEKIANPLGRLTTGYTVKRRQKVYEIIKEMSSLIALREALQGDLTLLADSEAKHLANVINSQLKGIDVDAIVPGATTLKSIVTTDPFQGATLKEWFSDLESGMQNEIRRQVTMGVVEGETSEQIVRSIRGTAGQAFTDGTGEIVRRHIRTIVRTSLNAVSTNAREATYRENDDLIAGVQYVATLDSKTTPICMSLDGKVFPVDEGPRPPQHFNCRSTTTPVLKSFRQLGIPLKEIPDATRASIDGQVPAKVTYNDWLKRQPASVQDAALGPTRGKLFRDGEIEDVSRFVNPSTGQAWTLKQLEQREDIEI